MWCTVSKRSLLYSLKSEFNFTALLPKASRQVSCGFCWRTSLNATPHRSARGVLTIGKPTTVTSSDPIHSRPRPIYPPVMADRKTVQTLATNIFCNSRGSTSVKAKSRQKGGKARMAEAGPGPLQSLEQRRLASRPPGRPCDRMRCSARKLS